MTDIILLIVSEIFAAICAINEFLKNKRGDYNPSIFRKQEENASRIEALCYLGAFIPIFLIGDSSIRRISITLTMITILVPISLLNIKWYLKLKSSKILIQTLVTIFILSCILTILWLTDLYIKA